ncbi:MAG: PLP-dependent transferase [Collinsella sp.]|nr:PLP-dependent transferase [Collinsella sp.]
MRVDAAELAARIAERAHARASWIVPAAHVPDLLAKLGLIGRSDRLVVFADDFTDAFLARFPRASLAFAATPTPEDFRAAEERVLGLPDVAEGTPASYAHAPGLAAERTFWFVNSIGGRGLRVPDLRALARAAAASGTILMVDNTVASFFACRPLALGAQVSFEALDRVAAGALSQKAVAVSVAPAVTGRGRRRRVDPLAEEAHRLLTMRLAAGSCALSDEDLARVAEGLDTLDARMQAHMDNARVIASYLACHHGVEAVAYPGLDGHPDRALAAGVLEHGFGPAVDFTAPVAAGRFLTATPAAGRDAVAGGVRTRMSALAGDDSRLIRLFAGLDDPLAIVDSLDQALRLFCNPPEP